MRSSTKSSVELERRVLRLSVVAGICLGVAGVAVGLIDRSPTVLFDGFYTFIGVVLSSAAMRVARLAGAGPTKRYPFGREALTPLIIGVEGVALLATCAYAGANAIVVILDGGSRVPSVLDLTYAITCGVVSVVIWGWMRSQRGYSELLTAESTAWWSGAGLGLGMIEAFLLARVAAGSWRSGAHYVDPSLVLIASAAFVGPPVRMIRRTLRELVEGQVEGEIDEAVSGTVARVSVAFRVAVSSRRVTKVGRKCYIELEYVVDSGWTVASSDALRASLTENLGEALEPYGLEAWLTVEFSAVGFS